MDFWGMFQGIAKDYGVWAALFLSLFAWTMYQNDKREKRYIQREEKFIEREEQYITIVKQFSDSYKNIESDVQQIKNKLWS